LQKTKATNSCSSLFVSWLATAFGGAVVATLVSNHYLRAKSPRLHARRPFLERRLYIFISE
jgi:hypothetical protein